MGGTQNRVRETVKPDAEDMSYFSHYDRFYSLLTVAIMVVIVSAFDVNTVSNPKSFMTLYAESKGAMILCRYLYGCGLPLLATRMAIRSNSGATIDEMLRYMGPIFRSMGKVHYARFSVLSQHITAHLKGPLGTVWDQYRTLSLRGNNSSIWNARNFYPSQ